MDLFCETMNRVIRQMEEVGASVSVQVIIDGAQSASFPLLPTLHVEKDENSVVRYAGSLRGYGPVQFDDNIRFSIVPPQQREHALA